LNCSHLGKEGLLSHGYPQYLKPAVRSSSSKLYLIIVNFRPREADHITANSATLAHKGNKIHRLLAAISSKLPTEGPDEKGFPGLLHG
jgi:hypothetical protein